jgi:hypothetical protein
MIFVSMFALALAGSPDLVVAQEEQRPEIVQKVISVEHVDVRRVQKVLSIFEVMVEADPQLKVIAVKGLPDSVAAVELAIKRLDVPPPPASNIELTVYMLNATEAPVSDTMMPSELEEVIHQLKNVFTYKGFRLWETLVLRTREGTLGGSKNLHGVISDTGARYEFQLDSAVLVPDEEKGNMIRLNHLLLEMTSANVKRSDRDDEEPSRSAAIRTDIDVREGQKVVVGKANVGVKEKSALILVVTAKVLE